ncbi:hypothetical protein [Streptococcus loxodontisalivarius]|uniref:Uncharacterized protein n=1 Tax=Streptococcus loxodontisalivarius TaxID=1349415 RepID=A0ABS2PQ05_9STRE|nr:hypothetical protein [Streptococcus loxodontisalivarius]MBM7642117.1 hypothetical protein [Streptococcus loxodontisalivarius]
MELSISVENKSKPSSFNYRLQVPDKIIISSVAIFTLGLLAKSYLKNKD